MKMLVEYIGVSVARPILGRSGVHMISRPSRKPGRYLPRHVGEACLAETEFSKAPVGNSV